MPPKRSSKAKQAAGLSQVSLNLFEAFLGPSITRLGAGVECIERIDFMLNLSHSHNYPSRAADPDPHPRNRKLSVKVSLRHPSHPIPTVPPLL